MIPAATALAIVLLAQLNVGDMASAVTAGTVDFTGMIMRLESLYITTAAYVIIQGMSQIEAMKNAFAYRLKPFAPALLTTGMAFLPSFRLGAWDETLLYGLSLGAFIGWGHKLLKQSVFGRDRRIKSRVDDPALQKLIDEYHAAKQRNTMSTRTKTSLKAHFEKLLT